MRSIVKIGLTVAVIAALVILAGRRQDDVEARRVDCQKMYELLTAHPLTAPLQDAETKMQQAEQGGGDVQTVITIVQESFKTIADDFRAMGDQMGTEDMRNANYDAATVADGLVAKVNTGDQDDMIAVLAGYIGTFKPVAVCLTAP